MRRRLGDQQQRIVALTEERDSARKELGEKAVVLIRTNKELNQMRQQYRDDLARSQGAVHALEDKLQRRDQETKMLRAELQQAQNQHASTVKLLEARTQELKGAQPFLTTADSLSGADIIAIVQGLNAEIFQTAAFMADSFDFKAIGTDWGDDQKVAYKRIRGSLGATMALLLPRVRHCDDPTLIQIALQSCLVYWYKDISNAWGFDNSLQSLTKVYQRIHRSGELHWLKARVTTDLIIVRGPSCGRKMARPQPKARQNVNSRRS